MLYNFLNTHKKRWIVDIYPLKWHYRHTILIANVIAYLLAIISRSIWLDRNLRFRFRVFHVCEKNVSTIYHHFSDGRHFQHRVHGCISNTRIFLFFLKYALVYFLSSFWILVSKTNSVFVIVHFVMLHLLCTYSLRTVLNHDIWSVYWL